MQRATAVRAGAVAAALAAAVPFTAHAAGAASLAPYRTYDAMVAVVDGPAHDHHARIDTRLYVPRSASRAHPQPAILMTHGFGLSKDAAEVTSSAEFFARHGYVVLTYTSQGFGHSSGCIRLDSASYDAQDASELISKLLAPRADVTHDPLGPVVGMVGGSYGGGITLVVAEHDRRIRAIAPGRTWNSLQYALFPNNAVQPGDPTGFSHQRTSLGVFKGEWTSLFFADGNAMPAEGNGGCPQEKASSGDPTQVAGTPCTGYPAEVCQGYAQTAATGDAPPQLLALLAQSSGATWISRLRVPTLLVQGESDTLFNEDDVLATYLALRRAHVPTELIWNSGGHGGYDSQPGEGEVYGNGTTGLDHAYLPLRTLAWFDRWLKHEPVDTGPGFAYFEDWRAHRGSGPDSDQYGTAAAYPAQPYVRFNLALGAGGSNYLAPPGMITDGGTVSFLRDPALPPSYSETSNCSAPGSGTPCPGNALRGVPASDTPGEFAQFTSPALNVPVVSVGVPVAHIHLSHVQGPDLVFFAKVYDVAPDGTALLVKRLVAPVRVPDVALARAVDFHLLGFAHRFDRGHRIRLVLASTDATSVLGAAGDGPDEITVQVGAPASVNDQYMDGGPDPSWFALPVDDPRAVEPNYGPQP